MKTRTHILLVGIVAAGFSLPGFSLEWAETPSGALKKAESVQKDVIYVYTSPSMNQAGQSWIDALQKSPELDQALKDQYVFCQVDLPSKMVKDSVVAERMKLASKHGVNVLPVMVMTDSKGRAYGKVAGGILESRDVGVQLKKIQATREFKHRRDELIRQAWSMPPGEKSPFMLRALVYAPAESWLTDYPDETAVLEKEASQDPLFVKAVEASRRVAADNLILDAVSSLAAEPSNDKLNEQIVKMEKLASSDRLSLEKKQFVLLTCVYPLYVHQTLLNYNGGTNGACEEAFNRSIEILENVRDMGRSTMWGQHAHRIREELRTARLAAKKYD